MFSGRCFQYNRCCRLNQPSFCKVHVCKTAKAPADFRRNPQELCHSKFSSPQAFIQSRTDKKLSPRSVSVYSTRGGISQNSWRRMNPSVSNSLSCFVRELSIISPIWRRSCPKRRTSHLPIYQRSSILYFPPNSFCTVEIVLHRSTAAFDFLILLSSLPFDFNPVYIKRKGTSKMICTPNTGHPVLGVHISRA